MCPSVCTSNTSVHFLTGLLRIVAFCYQNLWELKTTVASPSLAGVKQSPQASLPSAGYVDTSSLFSFGIQIILFSETSGSNILQQQHLFQQVFLSQKWTVCYPNGYLFQHLIIEQHLALLTDKQQQQHPEIWLLNPYLRIRINYQNIK